MTETTFNEDGQIDTYTVLTTGTYEITVDGASGGSGDGGAGGLGAEVTVEVELTAGTTLDILVGEAGFGGPSGGGGGGSFVVEQGSQTVLAVAGGGGGAGAVNRASGSPGQLSSTGSGGGAGGGDEGAGGGGGYSGDGTDGTSFDGGIGGASFTDGGAGGEGGFGGSLGQGGFGGGGGSGIGGGGGGGYSGGDGANFEGGGGGGSYFDPAVLSVTETSSVNSGDGLVTIGIVCFVAGTRICTADGDRAVETLAVGDLVVTASGEHRPVKWLGHRRVDCRRHPRPDEAQPIRIAAHAFGENRPASHLLVSPGHAICLDLSGEVLITAGALVNGATVEQLDLDEVTYWHVELDSHDILLAENLPCESYIDMGNRGFFAESDTVALDASPDAPRHTHADYCRPQHLDGAVVERARAMLRRQAESLGYRLTTEGDAHLIADGRRVEPMRLSDNRLAFVLPAGAQDVSLRSRGFVPAATCPGSDDLRTLGLCVTRLQIDGAEIALDDVTAFQRGWHNLESGLGRAWRWTTGETPLPPGSRLIVVDLTGQGRYLIPGEAAAIGYPKTYAA